MTFATLNLKDGLVRVLAEMGFATMTPIQAAALPVLLAGRDLIGQSKTGSGKTAAFVLPILQTVKANEGAAQAMILCPTRELCDQVLRECQKFSKYRTGVRVVALVGGQPYPAQHEALANGAHVIVGTPGRTLEHLKSGRLSPSKIKMLVLDEADRLLEDGFAEELNAIIDRLPQKRQTVFFSATFPESVATFSKIYQTQPERVTITDDVALAPMITQYAYAAEKPEKVQMLLTIFERHPSACTLIFCRTKAAVNEIGLALTQHSVRNRILHADLKQVERDRSVALFRKGEIQVLIATDVAARGLDIDRLELVINFDLPASADTYIHRIGRTGRAGRTGTAVSIVTDYEAGLVTEIEAATGVKMQHSFA
jgi:ATP-independent RNA helicase DbpA